MNVAFYCVFVEIYIFFGVFDRTGVRRFRIEEKTTTIFHINRTEKAKSVSNQNFERPMF